MRLALCLMLLTVSALRTAAQVGSSTIDDQKSVAVTVYNSNIGLIKDTRTLRLGRGTYQLRFMDVAQQINPTTVHIKSLTAPATLAVVEQSYEYDLLNPQKILDKYVGQEVTLVLPAARKQHREAGSDSRHASLEQ